jgi:predicted transcriptional regulator
VKTVSLHVRLTVHLSPEQREALKTLSARTRRPMATFVREAIDRVLDKHGAPSDPPGAERTEAGGGDGEVQGS